MALRISAVLVALACLVALVAETRHPPRNLSPSQSEKTCRLPGNMLSVPCRLLDEYLQTTWDI